MGEVLCGLIAKIRDWSKTFPNNEIGGPGLRLRYVMERLEPGLEKLSATENEARLLAGNL